MLREDFLKMSDGDIVAMGKRYFIIEGKTDLKTPRVVDVHTNEEISAADYITHLYTKINLTKEELLLGLAKAEKVKQDEKDERMKAYTLKHRPVVEEAPVKRPRGRPRKAK